MTDIHRKAWEAKAQKRYPHLSKKEAIEAYKQEIGARQRGNKGNPNPPLKGDSERASELGRLGAMKRWNKDAPRD